MPIEVNLRKVCNYISQRSKTDFQCIVISLKDMFYERSDSLVGVCKDVGTSSSLTLTLDLTAYDKNEAKNKDKKRNGGKLSASKEADSPRKRKTRRSTSTDAEEGSDDENSQGESPILTKARRSPKLIWTSIAQASHRPETQIHGQRSDRQESCRRGNGRISRRVGDPGTKRRRSARKGLVDNDTADDAGDDMKGAAEEESTTQPEAPPSRGRGRGRGRKARKSASK